MPGGMSREYTLSDYWQNYLGEHPNREKLKALIAAEQRVLSPVVVWAETGDLIDGYTRHACAEELRSEGITIPPLPVHRKSFQSRQEAETYILSNQDAMRQLTPNERAWKWVQNHAAEIAATRQQARANQVDALAHAPKPPGDAPKEAEPINVRKSGAATAGVAEKIVGAALKLHDWGSDERRARLVAANYNHAQIVDAFTRGQLTYRDVDDILGGVEQREAMDAARNRVIEDTPTPAADGDYTNTIRCADAVEGLRTIPDNEITLVCTSPFYPLKDYSYDGFQPYAGDYEKYVNHDLREVFTECYRALRKGGRCVVQIDAMAARVGKYSVSSPILADLIVLMRSIGFGLLHEICWFKQCTAGKNGRVRNGSRNKVIAPFVRRSHEYVLVFFKEVPYLPENGNRDTLLAKEFEHFTISQWYIPPETRKFVTAEGVQHPCPFPETLVYRIVQLYSRHGDLVVDPFNGTGTTTFVAHCLGRRYVGVDQSQGFCQLATARLAAVAALSPAERLKRLRSSLFVPAIFERMDGWGLATTAPGSKSGKLKRRLKAKAAKAVTMRRHGKAEAAATAG